MRRMPESPRTRAQLDRIEAKLNALGRAIGGPVLKAGWEMAEAELPKREQTFRRRRCGCFVGSPHVETCDAPSAVRERAAR